jgi:phenylalanine-4-hydroxylase
MHLAQETDQWRILVNRQTNLRIQQIKAREYLDYLSDY